MDSVIVLWDISSIPFWPSQLSACSPSSHFHEQIHVILWKFDSFQDCFSFKNYIQWSLLLSGINITAHRCFSNPDAWIVCEKFFSCQSLCFEIYQESLVFDQWKIRSLISISVCQCLTNYNILPGDFELCTIERKWICPYNPSVVFDKAMQVFSAKVISFHKSCNPPFTCLKSVKEIPKDWLFKALWQNNIHILQVTEQQLPYLCLYKPHVCIRGTSIFETIILAKNKFFRILLRDQNIKHWETW